MYLHGSYSGLFATREHTNSLSLCNCSSDGSAGDDNTVTFHDEGTVHGQAEIPWQRGTLIGPELGGDLLAQPVEAVTSDGRYWNDRRALKSGIKGEDFNLFLHLSH